jgi:mono/diheme cytochrome c family protein
MIRKILKYTGIIVLSVIVLLVVVVLMRQDMTYDAPYPSVSASSDSAVIARGKYLVYGPAHCADCHIDPSKSDSVRAGFEVQLTGNLAFELPVGTFYTRNITPDKETGIGNWTDPELARAFRYGVKRDGRVLFDFMPFHDASDEDLTAIISFLRSQKPVKHKVPEHDVNMLGKVVKAFMIKPVGPSGEVPRSVKKDTSAAYGKYLTWSIANCRGCHTPRDEMTGAFIGEEFAGGSDIEGFTTANLTPHKSGRIYGWSQEQFIQRFREGRKIAKSPMPWNSFSKISDDELKAIYNYLQTIKPVPTKIETQLAKQ